MIRTLIRKLRSPLHANLSAMAAGQAAMRVSRLVAVVVLTRHLAAADYGAAAIVLTVSEFVTLFTRNGIAAKVVQAGAEELAAVAATAHTLTWVVCLGLMLIQGAIAVPVAWMFGDMRLALPIAAMGLVYLATPVSNIQAAFLQREGRLGRIAAVSAGQVVADNMLTTVLAVAGLGVWAIILPKLLVAPIWAVGVRTGHAWRPAGGASFAGWREIARFSRGIVGIEVLTTLQANVDNFIVGIFLGTEALGIYYFAFNAGLGITLGLVNAFAVAVYPHLCEVRADAVALSARYRASLRTLGGLVVPLVLAQVVAAPFYVPLVFGAKWAPAVPVLMLVCASALPRPFAAATSQLLRAVGRPDIELRWQAGLTVLLVAGLLIGVGFGLTGVAAAVLLVQGLVLSAYVLRAPRPFMGEAGAVCAGRGFGRKLAVQS